ncbi:MAG TPA: TMEM165/GDT1 family protein [Clostridia bacterium]
MAAVVVTLAEMGDKTQLLAMAFATRYKASKVLAGVFIATVLNHACAVALGNLIAHWTILGVWIRIIASLSFIFFGLWTIKGDNLDGEENQKTRFGAVMTVAIAFFIAELGDKTQLATITLSLEHPESPLGVLAGTTTGMMIADAVGIVAGVVLCKRIPEKALKLFASVAFIIFGLYQCFILAENTLHLNLAITAFLVLLLSAISLIIGRYLYKKSVNNIEHQVVSEYCKLKNSRE